jgi:hypothetical protein
MRIDHGATIPVPLGHRTYVNVPLREGDCYPIFAEGGFDFEADARRSAEILARVSDPDEQGKIQA